MDQVEGGEGSVEGDKGTRLRGKSKAGLILEQTLLDPIAKDKDKDNVKDKDILWALQNCKIWLPKLI